MVKNILNLKKVTLLILCGFILNSCAGKLLKQDVEYIEKKKRDFDQNIQITEIPPQPTDELKPADYAKTDSAGNSGVGNAKANGVETSDVGNVKTDGVGKSDTGNTKSEKSRKSNDGLEFSQDSKIKSDQKLDAKVGGKSQSGVSDKSSNLDNKKALNESNKSKPEKDSSKVSGGKKTSTKDTQNIAVPRQPELESDIGFVGRRPVKDPFRVGEQVVLDVNYLKMNAGQLTIEIPHFVNVNGRKAYRMITRIKTNTVFSSFYEVNDWSESMMDYEHMAPLLYAMHVRESGQLREAQATFDIMGGKAKFSETKISKKKGTEEKKQEWDIPSYSQNVFTAYFYLRAFQWDVGTVHQFRVAHDKENIIFKATGIRKEKLDTDAGEFDTIVIKPEITLNGVFKPVGDIFFWLTNDDRKQIVRIEAEIKIGTLVAEAVSIK